METTVVPGDNINIDGFPEPPGYEGSTREDAYFGEGLATNDDEEALEEEGDDEQD